MEKRNCGKMIDREIGVNCEVGEEDFNNVVHGKMERENLKWRKNVGWVRLALLFQLLHRPTTPCKFQNI